MKKIFFVCVIFSLLFSAQSYARVDIIPRKIVMDSRDRSAEITILNLFDKEGTFRIDVVYNRQNEDGTYTVIETPLSDDFDAGKIVRFSPRQFTLPSQGRQKIRLSLRKPADLPAGEYRFHVKALRFAELDGGTAPKQSGMGISMKMNVGVSIPVVVRHGDTQQAEAKITKPRLVSLGESGRPELQMTIERTGQQSSIGSLGATWEPDGYDQVDRIGYIENMNIFPEISYRDVAVPLKYIPKGKGAIRLRYIDNATKSTTGTVLDELILDK